MTPGPSAFMLEALLMVGDVFFIPLHPQSVLVGVGASLLGAWWAHRALQRLGRAAWPAIIGVAAAVALVYVVSATYGLVRPSNQAGVENHPEVVSLDLLAFLGGMYWDGLRRAMRWCLGAAAVLVVVVGCVLHPVDAHPEWAAIQALWALPVLVGALRLQRELDAGAARYAKAVMDRDAKSVGAAFGKGVGVVTELVRTAREEAHERLAAVEGSLEPDLAALVTLRLEEVDRRLQRMVAPPSESL